MAMLKIISDSKRHGVLLVFVTIALVLVILLVFQARRSGRMAYGGKEQSLPRGPQVTITMPPQNDAASPHKPEHFPYGMARIAFERDGVVYLYDAQTKETRRIGDGFEPDISLAGDLIAFTADRDDSLKNRSIRLFSLKTNTGGEIQSLGELQSRSPRWSHDGTKLAFDVIIDDRTHVGVLNPGTGEWDDITKGLVTNNRIGPHFSSWSPDDESVVCQDLSTIYEISLSGSVLNKIPVDSVVPRGEVASDIRFQFSRDKKLLLFEGARKPDYTAIYLFNLADQKLRRLTPKTMDGFEPVWLPSQDAIMFSRGRDDPSGFVSDLCIMSLDTGKVTTIIENASSGSYSTR